MVSKMRRLKNRRDKKHVDMERDVEVDIKYSIYIKAVSTALIYMHAYKKNATFISVLKCLIHPVFLETAMDILYNKDNTQRTEYSARSTMGSVILAFRDILPKHCKIDHVYTDVEKVLVSKDLHMEIFTYIPDVICD
jgi:hypothetical protein